MRQGATQPSLAAPSGAGDEHVVRLAQPVAAGQVGDKVTVEAAAGAPVDVLHAGRGDFEPGGLEQALQAAVVPPGDLALHEQREPLIEAQGGGCRAAGLLRQGVDHAVQAQRAQLVEGVFIEHRASPSVVVIGAAHVLVLGQGGGRRRGGIGVLAIEPALENRGHAAVSGRADRQRPGAGGFQARRGVLARQALEAQAGAVALLGMWSVLQLPGHHAGGGPADALAPRDELGRGPLQVRAVRGRHVLGRGGVLTPPGVQGMAGHALVGVEDLQ